MARDENFDGVLEPMKEKLTCSYCKKFFKEPMSMICGHVFCKKCIPKNHEASVCFICKATCKSKDLRLAPYITEMFQAYQETDALIKAKKNHHPSPSKSVSIECLSRGSKLGTDNFDQNDSSSSRKRGRALSIIDSCQKVPMNANTKGMKKVAQLKFSAVQRYEDDCALCHSFRNMEGMGQLLCIQNGKVVSQPGESSEEIAQYAHENCLNWAAGVHFEDNQVHNLDMVVNSTARQICNKCGLNNATIHCFYKHCSRKYHAPCAYYIDECRWDTENLRMLCPAHASKKLP